VFDANAATLDQKSPGMKLSAMTDKNTALVPEEGWHCLHLFYRIEYGQWQLLSRDEQNAARASLSFVESFRTLGSSVCTYSSSLVMYSLSSVSDR